MSSHTPGPWRVANSLDEEYVGACVMSSRGHLLADCNIFGRCAPQEAELMANAHLIAAAPDLLTALQGVLAVADRKTDEFDAARAAIARAEARA